MFGFAICSIPVSQLIILAVCACCCWFRCSRLSLLTSALFSSIWATKRESFSLKKQAVREDDTDTMQTHTHAEDVGVVASHRLSEFCCWCKPTSAGSNSVAPDVTNVAGFYKA
jgi:hypothetical protein